MSDLRLRWLAGAGILALAACGGAQQQGAPAAKESADEFVERVNRELAALGYEADAAGFTQATYITPDTQLLSARANERLLAAVSRAAEEAKRYEGQKISPQAARAIELIKQKVAAPAPPDAAKRAELAQIGVQLEALYGEGKYCPKGPESCRNLDQLSETLAKSRNYAQLTEAWVGWHNVGAQMRKP
jgi:peptidyl-dipeptidase A